MQKPLVINIFAPPGGGKGTQAELLSERFNLYYFESAKIIEANIMTAEKGVYEIIEGKKYFLAEERRFWKTGILNSPPLVTLWFARKIKELAKEGRGLVMTGSPRTLYEGKRIIPLLQKLYGTKNIKIILIKLSAEESIFRNSRRRICELMRHPILYTKETSKLTRCPLDGSKLLRRKGLDDPETIKVRLKEYKERTLPLVKYYKEQGLTIKEINGEQSVEDVFKDILKAIK